MFLTAEIKKIATVNFILKGGFPYFMFKVSKTGMMSGELLVFDYAPRLRVAGTFHSLTEQDKESLEAMINESDFVALEWDEIRHQNQGVFEFSTHSTKRGYDKEKEIFYIGFFDNLYLLLFIELNRLYIAGVNLFSGRMAQAGLRGIFKGGNEFEFCYDSAKKKGKEVYLVDRPSDETIQRLIELSLKTKLSHLLSRFLFRKEPEEVKHVLGQQRDEYMLEAIVEKEGPISELTRQGLLVVGYDHAKRYQKAIES
jgi:hypothetical protein